MATAKALEPAFQGVGSRPGLEIWRIENFQLVPLPKADYGKFYAGDSYVVLQTSSGRGGAYAYDIHFWLGKDTSNDEAGTAAIKTVELDAILGGRAVQHRELQSLESDETYSPDSNSIIRIMGTAVHHNKAVQVDPEDIYATVDWAHKIDPLFCISMHGVTERYFSDLKVETAGYVRLLLDAMEDRITTLFTRFVDDAHYRIEKNDKNVKQTGVMSFVPRFALLATCMEQYIQGQTRDLVDQTYIKIVEYFNSYQLKKKKLV